MDKRSQLRPTSTSSVANHTLPVARAADLRQGGAVPRTLRTARHRYGQAAGHLRRRRGHRHEPAMPPRPGLHVHLGGGGLQRYACVGLLQLPARHRLPDGRAEAGRPSFPPGQLGPENLTVGLPGPEGCRRVAAGLISDLERIYQRKEANKELSTLLAGTGATLTDLHGIGPSGAARLLAEVGDVTRFPAKAHFASVPTRSEPRS
jgi:transposase